MIYSMTYYPRVDDYDLNSRLSYTSMLEVLQSAMIAHSLSIGDAVRSGDIGWVLVDWMVRIIRRPLLNETLEIKTWSAENLSETMALREFEVFARNSGEMLIQASAKMCQLNMKTAQVEKLDPKLADIYKPEKRVLFGDRNRRIAIPEQFDEVKPVIIRRNDFDFNHHVNNPKYLEYVTECLPEELWQQEFGNLRVIYHSSVRRNQMLNMLVRYDDDTVTMILNADDHLAAIFELRK